MIATSENGLSAVQLCKKYKPELLLISIRLTELNGVLASEQIRAQSPHTKIVLLAEQYKARHELLLLAQAVKIGVHGIITYNLAFSQLLDAVQQVLQGKSYMPEQLSSLLRQILICPELQNSLTWLDLLNVKQKLILQLTAEGYTAKEIGGKLFLSSKTVEFHRRVITKKLSFATKSEWVKFSIRNGLIEA